MFERFSEDARAVVVSAQQEANRFGHNYVGTEHLLLGLMAHGSGVGVEVLAEAGVRLDTARSAALRMLGRGFHAPSPEEERAALAAIGIDLDLVRERIEEVFGPGALERPLAFGPRRRWGLRRRARRPDARCASLTGDSRFRFPPRAKKAVELSVVEAEALGRATVEVDHLLLGLLDVPEGIAAHLLGELGVDVQALRARLLTRLTDAA